MTEAQPPEEILINDRALNKLVRAITLSQGNFSLILARCNYGQLRDQAVQQLKVQCSVEIRELHLSPSTKTLYTTIQADLGEEKPAALMIFGLEQVAEIEQVLISTNQVREEFRKNFPFPIVLWVNDDKLKRIIQLMPDFKSWTGNSIKFEIAPTDLAQSLNQSLSELFTAILNVGEGKFLKLEMLHPKGADLSCELESALIDLQSANSVDRLQASLQFWAGREADLRGEKAQAKADYKQSIAFWQAQIATDGLSPDDWACYGCVLFHLGLWWRQYATQHRSEYQIACLQAQNFYQQSLAAFEKTERPELVARFINTLGEVLTRLGQWDELVTVAQRSIKLHQTYLEPIRLAYAHALLAEVALQRQDWGQLKEQAELALQTNELPSISTIDWTDDRAQRRNFYLLLLAEAQRHLNQVPDAIANLETAQASFNPQYDPTVYIRILATLRSLYFEQGNYLQAFETKQEQRSIEQQYGLRAFVGAGRLQSRRQVINPGLAAIDAKAAVTQEIAASGRLIDVNRLLERIGRTDHKLTVIYGQSGVGKSSLVQAGLVPALKQRAIDARDVVPVLLQVYTDWSQSLSDRLAESLAEVHGLSLPLFLDSMAAFVGEIQKNGDKNLLTVLIFDQFEEFFFAYKDPAQRRPFFEFLRDCLNVPYVKVILSLREDYLHYLLECNRLTHLDVIDNNILDKKILYHLGNFSPEDGRTVIQSLTDACQFNLEPALLDELVRDLAGDLNEVRPIELQVVGAQMQTEQVTTLAQYLADGPKESFVGRFLEEVIADCGTSNVQFAKIILYLLTDDNLTRPLKTRAELESELLISAERLDLILNILVKSGLVFQVPGFPADRYQLVHDYLVLFVRQQQAAGLVAELEKEREQRKLTEEKLNQVLKQQLKAARRTLTTTIAFAAGIVGISSVVALVGANSYLFSLSQSAVGNSQLDELISSIKAIKMLKKLPVAVPEIKLLIVTRINNAINNTREKNRLEGHVGKIKQVVFSPDSQILASISEDKTAKIWKVESGKLLGTLKGEKNSEITKLSFSQDSSMIAYSTGDKKIRFWSAAGSVPQTISVNEKANAIAFSHNKKLLSVAEGKEVSIWDLSVNRKVSGFQGHIESIDNVRFSPSGNIVATSDPYDGIKFWSLDGTKAPKSISVYGLTNFEFSPDGKSIVARDQDDKIITFSVSSGNQTISIENSPSSRGYRKSPDGKLEALLTGSDLRVRHTSGSSPEVFLGRFSGNSDRSFFFSPNSKILASTSDDKVVTLWNIENLPLKQVSEIPDIRFSPDSNFIAAIADNKINIFDRTGIFKRQLNGDSSMFSWSPQSDSFVSKGLDMSIKLKNQDRRKEIEVLTSPNGIRSVAIDKSGSSVVSSDNNGNLLFWNNNKPIKVKSKDGNFIKRILFSPDGRVVACVQAGKIQLWRNDGAYMKEFAAQFSENIKFSPDSKQLVIRKYDGFLELAQVYGKPMSNVTNANSESVYYSPDSKVIAFSSMDSNVTLRRQDGSFIARLKLDQEVNTNELVRMMPVVYFNPNSTLLAVVDGTRMVKIFNLQGEQIMNLPHRSDVTNLDFSLNNDIVTSTNRMIYLWRSNGTFVKVLRGHSSQISQVLFHPTNGKTIVSADIRGMVQMWGKESDSPKILRFPDEEKEISEQEDDLVNRSLEFSEDGDKIILRTFDDTERRSDDSLTIWNSAGIKLKEIHGKNDIACRNNCTDLFWIENNKSFNLFNLKGELLKSFNHQANITHVIVSPDGELLASASDDHSVILWNRNGIPIKKFNHRKKVNSLSFSADSKVLASASDDHTIKLWNNDRQLLKQLNHDDKVNMVKFSHVANILASASDDMTVRFWTSAGDHISTVDRPSKIRAVGFSLDGKVLISSDQKDIKSTRNSTMRLWNIADGKEVSEPIENYSVYQSAGDIRPAIPYGFRFDWISNSMRQSWGNRAISPDQEVMVLFKDGNSIDPINNRLYTIEYDLDYLLSKACRLVKNYLDNSQKLKVNGRDQHICDGIIPAK
jgi:WD40 repeat protein/tetratricopeptide (TPR) repeat protein